jgi:hypothetical protein
MESIFIILVCIYIIGLLMLEPSRLQSLKAIPVQVGFVIVIIIAAFKFPIFSVALLVAFIATRVKLQSVQSVQSSTRDAAKVQTAILSSIMGTGNKDMKYISPIEAKCTKADDLLIKPDPEHEQKHLEQAQKAIEKYVVDDYLSKASNSYMWDETNYNTFPNPLGQQINIQGIDKTVVGYNQGFGFY